MSTDKLLFTFNLPYNQSSSYWLAVFTSSDDNILPQSLLAHGMQKLSVHNSYILHISNSWYAAWKEVRDIIASCNMTGKVEVALITGDKQPDPQEFTFSCKPVDLLDKVADSLWLGEALLNDSIVCYMQPVLDKQGKIFGYEAFARLETEDATIGGGKIIEAGKRLNAEYLLDRYLHMKAINTFISSDLDGFLFINLIPGFIHRPEKYLEILSEAAKFNGMPAKRIVLDFTKSETPRDISHMKAIFDFCRLRGYLLSLDDISSFPAAKKILETVHPDFIKLDIELVRQSAEEKNQHTISELVEIAHEAGARIIAEGVEDELIYKRLQKTGVDLFQGYYFSPPVTVSKLKNAVG